MQAGHPRAQRPHRCSSAAGTSPGTEILEPRHVITPVGSTAGRPISVHAPWPLRGGRRGGGGAEHASAGQAVCGPGRSTAAAAAAAACQPRPAFHHLSRAAAEREPLPCPSRTTLRAGARRRRPRRRPLGAPQTRQPCPAGSRRAGTGPAAHSRGSRAGMRGRLGSAGAAGPPCLPGSSRACCQAGSSAHGCSMRPAQRVTPHHRLPPQRRTEGSSEGVTSRIEYWGRAWRRPCSSAGQSGSSTDRSMSLSCCGFGVWVGWNVGGRRSEGMSVGPRGGRGQQRQRGQLGQLLAAPGSSAAA